MSHVSLKAFNLFPGWKVRLVADQGDYTCEGVVQSVDLGQTVPLIKLRECKDTATGKLESGLQVFKESDILKLSVVDKQADSTAQVAVGHSRKAVGDGDVHKSYSKPVVKNIFGEDNQHLRRLYEINIPSVLAQKQIAPPPRMVRLDLQPGKPFAIPFPEQDCEHTEGDRSRSWFVDEVAAVREYFWQDQRTPPTLNTFPEKLYFIDEDVKGEDFSSAVAELLDQRIVGLSVEGQSLGRGGNLSLLLLSTSKKVFLFDVVRLGSDRCFDHGLRDILQSARITKVMHDCRQASDILKHKFAVDLNNVSDTLASHSLFLAWALFHGHLSKYAVSYNHIVRSYFGVKGSHLFFPHYRVDFLDEDTSIWMERPLPPQLLIGAVRNAAFLLDLDRATKQTILVPTRRATEVMLQQVRDADEMDADVLRSERELLPSKLVTTLPQWRPDKFKAGNFGEVEEESRMIHMAVAKMDPFLIFSKDCMHQRTKDE